MRLDRISIGLGILSIAFAVAPAALRRLGWTVPASLIVALWIAATLFGVACIVSGLRRVPVKGALSRKAIRQLRGLRREIHGTARLFKRWEDPGPPADVPATDRFIGITDTHGQLEQWAHSMRLWCREYRPQAVAIFWNPPKDKAKLELAEYYAEQINQVRSEVRREQAAGLSGRLTVVLEKLGALHREGSRFADGLLTGSLGLPTMSPELRNRITTWEHTVNLYLHDHRDLGESYSSRFTQNATFPGGPLISEEGMAASRQAWETAVRRRCDNLTALISELQQQRREPI